MKIQPADLTKLNYVLLDRLEHNELAPFIRTYLRKRTRHSVLYCFSNALAFSLAGYLFFRGYFAEHYDAANRFTYFSYGLAIAFLLVPLHEYIHLVAYRRLGAMNTSYGVNLKRFYFMALADQFVANREEFQMVALAPFVVITSALVILLGLVGPETQLTVAGTMLTHTAMCSGDFGLLSYFDFHKNKEVITYDDIQGKVSFFYGK